MEQLEKEFAEHVKKVQAQINEKLKIAREALNAACALADENGVSFSSDISELAQDYTVSPNGKFADIDKHVAYDITGTYSEWDARGWQHSAVC